MKVTSAYANKLIRGYREELAAIVSNERDTCTTTYGASETPIEAGYNFTSTQDEMDALIPDEATEQTTYYETGWYEPDVLGSGGSYLGVTKATSEEEALQRLLKHSADYAHRITLYKKDGKTIKREIAEYDQWEKKWRTA